MQIFLVGGAVRDRLLNRSSVDKDYVVVGATPELMLMQGFTSVGKDFPVFLHPKTGEAYALARTERKIGHGYQGFTFFANPAVTLQEDLARRDLTINAIAQDLDGNLIDPFQGIQDLENKLLRHVSPAFCEDPVRLLRVARFAARFASLGFKIAPETLQLLQLMVSRGEMQHLVAERVWHETQRALTESTPSAFLRVLRDSHALKVLFPEIDALYGVPQRVEFHPEVDTGTHVEMVLDMAATIAPGNALVAYCALLHDLGKGLTTKSLLPRHVGHETSGIPLVQAVSKRLKVPHEYAHMAKLVCQLHLHMHRIFELRADSLLKILEALDIYRKPMRLKYFCAACEADQRGRLDHADDSYPQTAYLQKALFVTQAISADAFVQQGLCGEAIGHAIRHARLEALAHLREAHHKV